jgi:hypothetical protein
MGAYTTDLEGLIAFGVIHAQDQTPSSLTRFSYRRERLPSVCYKFPLISEPAQSFGDQNLA